MSITLKKWSRLGLGAAFASGALAACGSPEPSTPDAPQGEAQVEDSTVSADLAQVGEGEGGEGEGGVAISQAATDPIVYMSALAITEAHIIAARDAHALGENEAAAEMFAHPVSEVLFDMQPVFEARGVADFSDLLTETSAAVFAGESPDEISVRADNIITALREAATKAPEDGTSAASISAGVAVDQIERAADMYRIATTSEAYEPYLDGYGFYKAGEAVYLKDADSIRAEDEGAASAIEAALAQLASAYPSAVKPEALNADISALTVSASNAVLAVKN